MCSRTASEVAIHQSRGWAVVWSRARVKLRLRTIASRREDMGVSSTMLGGVVSAPVALLALGGVEVVLDLVLVGEGMRKWIF